jgi:hypothetical protein
MQGLLLLLLGKMATGLFCSVYDHSQPTVQCVQNCPGSTVQVGDKCLGGQQYLFQGQVFMCQGYISTDRALCCPSEQYIQNGQCLPCRGQVYNNGLSCCSSDHYLDLTQTTPNCIELSTGACPQLKLNSPFKICCSADKMYKVDTGTCVLPGSYSCDSSLKVCCGMGQKIEYLEDKYRCVNYCSWGLSTQSQLLCQQKYCSKLNSSMPTGPSQPGRWGLLSFSGKCCYGLDSGGQCVSSN